MEPEQLRQEPQIDTTNQDLEAHMFTGQGREAKHMSRIMHGQTAYAADEQIRGFQEAVVAKKQEEYMEKINALLRNRWGQRQQANRIRSVMDQAFLQNNDALLGEYEQLTKQTNEWRVKERTAAGQLQVFQNEWLRTPQARKHMTPQNVADEIAAEEKKLAAIGQKIMTSSDALAQAVDSGAQYEQGTGLFASAKKRFYTRKSASASERMEKYSEQYLKQEEKIRGLKAQQTRTTQIGASYWQTLRELEYAQAVHEEYERRLTDFCARNAHFFAVDLRDNLTPEEQEANVQKQKYLEAYGLRRQSELAPLQAEELRQKSNEVEAQVQRADVLDMAKTGYDGTVRAIALDGEMYYDRMQLYQMDEQQERNLHYNPETRAVKSTDVGGLVERDEEKILLEEESVINQLERLDVFQYINSDNLMEYMDYDETMADFIFQAQANAGQQQAAQQPADQGLAVQQVLEQLRKYGLTDDVLMQSEDDWENMKDGMKDGTAWLGRLLWSIVKDGVFDFAGVTALIDSKRQSEEGAQADAENNLGIGIGNMAQLAAILLNLEGLGLLQKMKAAGLARSINHVGTAKWLGQEWIGAADPSVVMGIGNLIGIVENGVKVSDNRQIEANVSGYGRAMKERGLHRFGRIMDNAAAENKIKQLEGYTDAVGAGLTLLLALTGVGGLLVTIGSVGIKTLIKKIGASRIRSETSEEIIKSPAVLGGLFYNRHLINEEHFRVLFYEVTGVNEPALLGDVLKVVDGIDLHRAARRAALIPDPEVDGAMRQLGFTDPEKYRDIKLSSIYQRIGMTEKNWRQVLRDAIEIKGVDYNTGWTKFVKGFTGNADHYADQKIDSRRDILQKRRREILAQRNIQSAV